MQRSSVIAEEDRVDSEGDDCGWYLDGGGEGGYAKWYPPTEDVGEAMDDPDDEDGEDSREWTRSGMRVRASFQPQRSAATPRDIP